MRIFTNGDRALETIKNSESVAEVLPWRDLLSDGSLPSGSGLSEMAAVQAGCVSACGWGEYDQILIIFNYLLSNLKHFDKFEEPLLWFEHDLHDQLQFLQILDFLSATYKQHIKITLICTNKFVLDGSAEELKSDFDDRQEITKLQFDFGKKAGLHSHQKIQK